MFAGRATSLTAGGHEVRSIERETAHRLHALAAEARSEQIRSGVDAAIGRTITQLTLHTEWGCPRRIVIRCDDHPGVDVQCGG